MAKEKTGALATQGASSIASSEEIGRDIRNAGLQVVGKDESLAAQALDAAQLMTLLEEAQDADQAAALLHRVAGIIPFANKRELALDGTSFSVLRLVIREKGGFSGRDDVAALIRTANGSLEILSFEQNEGRNNFLAGLNKIVTKFGEATNWTLTVYGNDNAIAALQRGERPDDGDKYFYALVPRAFWTGYGTTLSQQEAVEAEYERV